MCIKTILELCHSLPTELALRILTEGASDPEYGMAFGVKGLLLARWVQREIAPILYHTVAIGNESQASSILLAVARDLHRQEYKVAKLIKSFIIRDPIGVPTNRYAMILAHTFQTLQRSTWKHLMVPIPLLIGTEKSGDGYLRLPTSVTYTGKGTMFGGVSYENVAKLRVTDYNCGLWEIKGLMAIAKQVSHLAIRISSNPWAGMSMVHLLADIPRLECLVVAVDIPPNEDHVSSLLNLKVVTMDHLPQADLSKTLIWQWNDDVDQLYHNEDADMFWAKVKAELA